MEMRAKAPVANVVSIGGAITEGVINGINEVCEFRKYSPPHGGGCPSNGPTMTVPTVEWEAWAKYFENGMPNRE
jgi:hypothetical protein